MTDEQIRRIRNLIKRKFDSIGRRWDGFAFKKKLTRIYRYSWRERLFLFSFSIKDDWLKIWPFSVKMADHLKVKDHQTTSRRKCATLDYRIDEKYIVVYWRGYFRMFFFYDRFDNCPVDICLFLGEDDLLCFEKGFTFSAMVNNESYYYIPSLRIDLTYSILEMCYFSADFYQ